MGGKERGAGLPLWEGDRIFLRLLAQEAPFFSLKLVYRGSTLVSASLNGGPARRNRPARRNPGAARFND